MKNNFTFSVYCIGIALLFIQMTFPISPKTATDTGIFDIQNEVQIQSNIDFDTENSNGINTYQIKRVSTAKLMVVCTFERQALPNPLIVNYDFDITKIDLDNYEMNIKAAMPFQSLYISSDLETIYEGTHLTYPNMPKVDEILPSAKGELKLQSKANNSHFLSYEIEVNNRKILKKENLSINGKNYEAYIHTYVFIQKTVLKNGQITSILEESVTEWLVPNHGLVKQDRVGKFIMPSENSFDVQSKSTLLNIE